MKYNFNKFIDRLDSINFSGSKSINKNLELEDFKEIDINIFKKASNSVKKKKLKRLPGYLYGETNYSMRQSFYGITNLEQRRANIYGWLSLLDRPTILAIKEFSEVSCVLIKDDKGYHIMEFTARNEIPFPYVTKKTLNSAKKTYYKMIQ